jgi:SNF2 family DNA or RNA helicase
VGNWHREAARFAPDLKVHVHHGAERHLERESGFRDADLVLTTYQLLARDREPLTAASWDALILDEAQNIKNPESQARKAVAAIRADHRFALSGTPVENRLSELWSILDVLNPGLLGNSTEFRRVFALPIERYRDEAKAAQLRRFTAPFIMRRLKTDRRIIRDLPEKQEMKLTCTLSREQASLYQATVQDMVAQVESSEGIQRKGLILATLMKLKQICNHPAQFLQDGSGIAGRSGKLDALEEILGEILDRGEKALVFTQFRELGELLATRLSERFRDPPLWLHGGTPKQRRDTMVASFQAEGGPGIFLLSLKAGGVGLNLTAASHVIHFDRWWNPAVENQATDRAFRIGQTRNVQVRKFICAGTLEEKIDALIESKRELAESVVGSGESWLTELDARSFRDLVSLSREALLDGEAANPEPKQAAPAAKTRAGQTPARPRRRSA